VEKGGDSSAAAEAGGGEPPQGEGTLEQLEMVDQGEAEIPEGEQAAKKAAQEAVAKVIAKVIPADCPQAKVLHALVTLDMPGGEENAPSQEAESAAGAAASPTQEEKDAAFAKQLMESSPPRFDSCDMYSRLKRKRQQDIGEVPQPKSESASESDESDEGLCGALDPKTFKPCAWLRGNCPFHDNGAAQRCPKQPARYVAEPASVKRHLEDPEFECKSNPGTPRGQPEDCKAGRGKGKQACQGKHVKHTCGQKGLGSGKGSGTGKGSQKKK